MKKNISILIAVLTVGIVANAQERKASAPVKPAPVKNESLVNTSHSNIRNHGMTTTDKKPVAPVKQKQVILTSMSNIKHHPQVATTGNKPVKQETAILTSRSNIKHNNGSATAVKQETKATIKR